MSYLGSIETKRRQAQAARPPGLRPLLFLDFAASSLSALSWPIEIGWAVIEDGAVRTGGRIIAPQPGWPLSDWTEGAERVHVIGLHAVLAGTPADAVAVMTDSFAGFDVVSDNADWEQRWLDRLREGRPRIPVQPLRRAVADRMEPHEADRFRCALLRRSPAHRAAADAARLAESWLAAIRGELAAG
jgi:hypothetical protein